MCCCLCCITPLLVCIVLLSSWLLFGLEPIGPESRVEVNLQGDNVVLERTLDGVWTINANTLHSVVAGWFTLQP